jgi:hypothetical protein
MYDQIGQQRAANRPVPGSGRRPGLIRATNPRRQVRTIAGGLEQVRPLKVHTNHDCNRTGWAGPFQLCAKQGKKRHRRVPSQRVRTDLTRANDSQLEPDTARTSLRSATTAICFASATAAHPSVITDDACRSALLSTQSIEGQQCAEALPTRPQPKCLASLNECAVDGWSCREAALIQAAGRNPART